MVGTIGYRARLAQASIVRIQPADDFRRHHD